jgi:hypothetical protein
MNTIKFPKKCSPITQLIEHEIKNKYGYGINHIKNGLIFTLWYEIHDYLDWYEIYNYLKRK